MVNPDAWRHGADEDLERAYFDDDASVPESTSWVRRFERWSSERTYERLRRAGVTGGRLLEVGIGSGALLAFMRERGFDVEGCDLSSAIAAKVRRTHGVTVHVAPLQTLQGPYDVVVMNHVVEHVSDPVGFLSAARRAVRPGGVLHIAVPNVGSWDARLPGWTSYQPYHLVYFDAITLGRTARRAQLVPVWCGTHEPFSGWFLSVLRTLAGHSPSAAVASRMPPAEASARQRPRRGPIEQAYRLAMVGTGAILAPLRALQSRLGRGEEAILIARRPTEGDG